MYSERPSTMHVREDMYSEMAKAIHDWPDFDVRYAANACDKLPPLQAVGTLEGAK